jgi:hypothetical protein
VRERTARERQSHRIPRAWLAVAMVAGLVWLGAALTAWARGNTVEARVRRTFGLSGAVDTASVRGELLRRFPLGTPEARLKAYVEAHHIGSDGISRYLPAGAGTTALIRVDSKTNAIGWIMASYMVNFEFDASRNLRDIHVREVMTGP